MVDIFEVAPQPSPNAPPIARAAHDARASRYQALLARLSATGGGSGDEEEVDGVYVDWLPQEHERGSIELHGGEREVINDKGDDKPLVGTFADAAAAMV